MIGYILCLGVGTVGGIFCGLKMRHKEEMTTDDCVQFLTQKGFWVNLNTGNKK